MGSHIRKPETIYDTFRHGMFLLLIDRARAGLRTLFWGAFLTVESRAFALFRLQKRYPRFDVNISVLKNAGNGPRLFLRSSSRT